MAGEVRPAALAARVHLERGGDERASFLLDVALQVPPGITVLFGPSGAGKSTLLDCIAGLLRPDSGYIACGDQVFLDSHSGVYLPPQRRGVAYVFQTLALFPHMTVEENAAYGLSDLPRRQREARVAQALAAFRVDKLRANKPAEISGGERQRVALVRSLVTLPRVLLLDEPLTGLDAHLKSSLVDDLRAWNTAQKIPILYVTHSRDEVDSLAERVIALDRGRVIREGAPLEVLEAPRRQRLAQAAGFENLLSATVLDLRESDGVMRVRLDRSACEIEVPLGEASPGDVVGLAIRAGDILLATEHPRNLSARNVLPGRIVSLEQRGTLIGARVDAGVVFTVHLTPGAQRSLDLASGKPVWLVLKTHSCRLIQE